jgi:hypothetical protein
MEGLVLKEFGSTQGQMAGCCEEGNEPTGCLHKDSFLSSSVCAGFCE